MKTSKINNHNLIPNSIMNNMKINPDTLSDKQKSILEECTKYELESWKIAQQMYSLFANVANNGKQLFENALNKIEISEEDQEKALGIFEKTILKNIKNISEALVKGTKEGRGMLFNAMLSENVVDAMEAIINFKKSIDYSIPGFSDPIITAAAPIIISIIGAYCPVAAIVLKTSGLLDQAAEFLQTDNLDKTLEKIKEGIEKINNDKQLAILQEIAVKRVGIAEKLGIEDSSLAKMNINLKGLKIIENEIEKSPKCQEFVKTLAEYSDNAIASTEQDIDKSIQSIKKSAMQTVKDGKLDDQSIKDFEEILDKKLLGAKKELMKNLHGEIKIFDKLAKQCDVVDSITKDMKSYGIKNLELQNAVKQDLNKLKGDINKVGNLLKNNPAINKIAKEALGVNFVNELVVNRALAPQSAKAI